MWRRKKKITEAIWPAAAVIISHSSYVWKICNIQKTATTCSLQAPRNNSYCHGNHPIVFPMRWEHELDECSPLQNEKQREVDGGRLGGVGRIRVWLFTCGGTGRAACKLGRKKLGNWFQKMSYGFNRNAANTGGFKGVAGRTCAAEILQTNVSKSEDCDPTGFYRPPVWLSVTGAGRGRNGKRWIITWWKRQINSVLSGFARPWREGLG